MDIFNEGVDIPPLTHVLFLRPTQSFTVFLQQLGRGLRKAPGKDFLVAIDFVGNFRKAHVAPLALSGYTSQAEFLAHRPQAFTLSQAQGRLPEGCYVNADLDVQRVWDREIREIIHRRSPEVRLKDLYQEIKEDLGGQPPRLLDLLGNSRGVDPIEFPRRFGGWLRAKLACGGTLTQFERAVLDSPGEDFLKYLETDLNPNRSYKMVVLQTLLTLRGTSWRIEDIAQGFLRYYLENSDRIHDYAELAAARDPAAYALGKVAAHLRRMPLHYLSNTEADWFVLDNQKGTFALKGKAAPYWADTEFRKLVRERVEFLLARYFYQRAARCFVDLADVGQEGFRIESGFAERALSERAILPGERKRISLKLAGGKHQADLVRSKDGREYRVEYPGSRQLFNVLRETALQRGPEGKNTLSISVLDKDTLLVLLWEGGSARKGKAKEVHYARKQDSGYTRTFRELLVKDPAADSWELRLPAAGYEGEMDLGIRDGTAFLAWTAHGYRDITRFPQRIKAAATALFAEGHRGEYHVEARGTRVRITRR